VYTRSRLGLAQGPAYSWFHLSRAHSHSSTAHHATLVRCLVGDLGDQGYEGVLRLIRQRLGGIRAATYRAELVQWALLEWLKGW